MGSISENNSGHPNIPLTTDTTTEPQIRLNRRNCPQFVTIDKDGTSAVYIAKGANADVGVVQADRPAAANFRVFYFEVSILSLGDSNHGRVVVGLSANHSLVTREPGAEPQTIGYRSSDGKKMVGSSSAQTYGPVYGAGDTVGCGIDFIKRSVFFTANGALIGSAGGMESIPVFPSASLRSNGASVKFRFEPPFRFAVDSMIQGEVAKERRQISTMSISQDRVAAVVRSYLIRSGYHDTLRAFDSDCRRLHGQNGFVCCQLAESSLHSDARSSTPSTDLENGDTCRLNAGTKSVVVDADTSGVGGVGGMDNSGDVSGMDTSGGVVGGMDTSGGVGGMDASGGGVSGMDTTGGVSGMDTSGGVGGMDTSGGGVSGMDTSGGGVSGMDTSGGVSGMDTSGGVCVGGMDTSETVADEGTDSTIPIVENGVEGSHNADPGDIDRSIFSAQSVLTSTFLDSAGMKRLSDTLEMRCALRQAVLAGDVDKSISLLRQFSPSLIETKPPSLGLILLVTQKIVELLRGPKPDRMGAVTWMQSSLSPLNVTTSMPAVIQKVILEACGLLAYETPTESPLRHQFDWSRRSLTADILNDEVVASMGQRKPRWSPLHTLIRQLVCCRAALRVQGGVGCGAKLSSRSLLNTTFRGEL